MNLDLPVFELGTLKRAFYYSMGFNLLVCLSSMVLIAVSGGKIPGKEFIVKNTWLIMAVLLLFSFVFNAKSKKELKAVHNTPKFEEQVVKYGSYYKRKLVWNGFSIVVSGILFVVTEKNVFFYVLIFQLLLSTAYYPSKKLISKELNNSEIMFS